MYPRSTAGFRAVSPLREGPTGVGSPQPAGRVSDAQGAVVADRVSLGTSADNPLEPGLLSTTGVARYARISALEAYTRASTSPGSRIRDADFAYETAALSRQQVQQQQAVSTLSQANSLDQDPLRLLG